MLKKLLVSIMFSCLLLGSVSASAETIKVDIAGSPAGGAWYVGLGAYVKILSDTYPDMKVTLFPGGGIANVLRVAKGDSQIGITAASIVKAGIDGTEPYKQPVKLYGLANINDITRCTFVVTADSKITSLQQIADEKMPIKLGVSAVGGNAELFNRWILEEYGITKKSLAEWGGKLFTPTNAEAVSMMQEGQLDMDTWLGPGESFRYLELGKTKALRFLEVDEAVIQKVIEKHGLAKGTIPADYYGGVMGRDINTVVAPTQLFLNEKVSDEMAYQFAKALSENLADIAIALPSWNTMTPQNICLDLAAPMHPGAAKYYKESGCLK